MIENEKRIASISSATDAYLRGANYFLGISIDAYQHQRPLNNYVKDVTDIKNTLVEKYDLKTRFEKPHQT